MANNFLKQLQNVVETGKLQGVTNIKDLYEHFKDSGIGYKDFKKQMHDYGIYGHIGRHDMARLSGMYYGSKRADWEAKKPQDLTRVEKRTLVSTPNLTVPDNLALLNIPVAQKTSSSVVAVDPNSGPIYASDTTAAWRDYSTGTDQNPRLVAGNGNGPGTGYSRQDRRGIGPDNTPIYTNDYGQSYLIGSNGQAFNGQLDAETIDRLGLNYYAVPSVSSTINKQNSEYGEGFDNLTGRQQQDFFNWRKIHGGKGTVEEYKKAKGIDQIKRSLPEGFTSNDWFLNDTRRRLKFDQEFAKYLENKGIKLQTNYQGGLDADWLRKQEGYNDLYDIYKENNTRLFKSGGQMIKLQQGGKTSSQQDAVMQFVKALAQTLQADPQQVIQAAQQNPEALKSAVQVYQESKGDIQKAAQAFSQALESKTQAAKHGAKLNYLKSLKNKCAEDEELYYFKKGGSIDCGCRKKGGEIKEEKKESAVDKFKKMAKGDKIPQKPVVNKNDTIHTTTGPKRLVDKKETMKYPKFDHTKATQAEKDRASEKDYYRGDKDHGDHDPVAKDCGGSKMKLKKGDKVCPKCGKIHAAGAGCIAKFKMHKQGGSLIRFMQQGGGEIISPLTYKYNPMIHGISRTKSEKQLVEDYLSNKLQEEHDQYYNDYAMQSPNKEAELNISKSYFRTPTIPNVIKGTYHYIKSDPLNFYGAVQGLKQDYRKAVRKDKRKFPTLSKLIYGD